MSNLPGMNVELANSIRTKTYELFGGAIKMSLPKDLIDASYATSHSLGGRS